MNSEIKNFVKQFYILIQRDFWILNAANAVVGILIFFLDPHPLIQAGAIFFLFFKTVSFVRNSNIMPSISADFDRFSWKYFQGLPLAKSDLIKAFLITNFLVLSPLVIWIISFISPLSELFFEKNTDNFINALKVILFSVPLATLIGLLSIKNQITFPRSQYSKNEPRIIFYSTVKWLLIMFVTASYGTFGVLWIEDQYNIELPQKIGGFFSIITNNLDSWYMPFALMFFSIIFYRRVLTIWQTEKLGYIKLNWAPKRDYPIMAACAFLLIFPIQSGDLLTPAEFKSPLHKAVLKGQYSNIEKLLSENYNINEINKYGVAPIHAAAINGDLKMFRYLEGKGANVNLSAKTSKSETHMVHIAVKGNNPELIKYLITKNIDINIKNSAGSTPLHLAAIYCYPKILDLLIENGAEVQAENSKAETPLHYASKRNCFSAVTSLIEANANPHKKDQKGKLALDYVKNSRDLAYYLEKKTRTPAGKITP